MGTREEEVRAAGGVVVRPDATRDGSIEVVIVHRPSYDDWTLPKGKLKAEETLEQAAVREIEEETGLRCRLASRLPPVSYRIRDGRTKTVHYWIMEPESGSIDERPPDHEVDEVRWVSSEEAARRLSYLTDRRVLDQALGTGKLPSVPPA